jgi:uncharacterized protein with NRDE domain
MCTLAVYRGVCERYPLVVAANRDELLARPAAPPARLQDPAGVVAGRDLEAGGTWLGARVDDGLLIVGVLNRRPEAVTPRSPTGARSRGLLAMRTLRAHDLTDAAAAVESEDGGAYGPFNLFVADLDAAVVYDNGAGLRRTELAPGLSVLTNLDVRDPRCPRRAAAAARFGELEGYLREDPAPADLVAALAAVLGDHDAGIEPNPEAPYSRICVHAGAYGTRSSSIVFVERVGAVAELRYHHAEGPPCRTAFAPVVF